MLKIKLINLKKISILVKILWVTCFVAVPTTIYFIFETDKIYLKVILILTIIALMKFLLFVLLSAIRKNDIHALGSVLTIGGGLQWVPLMIMKYILNIEMKPYFLLYLIFHLLGVVPGLYFKRIKPAIDRRK